MGKCKTTLKEKITLANILKKTGPLPGFFLKPERIHFNISLTKSG